MMHSILFFFFDQTAGHQLLPILACLNFKFIGEIFSKFCELICSYRISKSQNMNKSLVQPEGTKITANKGMSQVELLF